MKTPVKLKPLKGRAPAKPKPLSNFTGKKLSSKDIYEGKGVKKYPDGGSTKPRPVQGPPKPKALKPPVAKTSVRWNGGNTGVLFPNHMVNPDNGQPYPQYEKQIGAYLHKIGKDYKKGGAVKDKNWIQKAVNPKHKGYCTPMSKATCTPKRAALARTFKAMAKKK